MTFESVSSLWAQCLPGHFVFIQEAQMGGEGKQRGAGGAKLQAQDPTTTSTSASLASSRSSAQRHLLTLLKSSNPCLRRHMVPGPAARRECMLYSSDRSSGLETKRNKGTVECRVLEGSGGDVSPVELFSLHIWQWFCVRIDKVASLRGRLFTLQSEHGSWWADLS